MKCFLHHGKYWKRQAKNFGRLQQNVSCDPTRKLLVIWRKELLKNKINKCSRQSEVMMSKGSYMAQNKLQQSSAQAERAEPSKVEQSGDAGNEIKTKQTHSSCHLALYRLTARWQYSHSLKHSIFTQTAFQPFWPSKWLENLDTLETKTGEAKVSKEKITSLQPS